MLRGIETSSVITRQIHLITNLETELDLFQQIKQLNQVEMETKLVSHQ